MRSCWSLGAITATVCYVMYRRDSRPTILWVTGKKPAEKGPGGDVLQPVQEEADQPQQQQQTEVAEDQPEDVLAEGHDTLEQVGRRCLCAFPTQSESMRVR